MVVVCVLLIVIAIFLFTGIMGLNFGRHWDDIATIDTLKNSVQTAVLLPRTYLWPSVYYDISLMSLTPEFFQYILFSSSKSIEKNKLLDFVESLSFKLRLRAVFVTITSFVILWVFALVWIWRKNFKEAFLAACFVGLSWETAYHARWIAPDTILMQFAAFTIMAIFLALEGRKAQRWLRIAAFSAGLGCGTKFSGLLLLVPVLLAARYVNMRADVGRKAFARYLQLLLIFGLTYLVTTPGTLFDSMRFDRDVKFIILSYSKWGLSGFTVNPGVQHLFLMIQYLCLVVFSKFKMIAFFLFAFSIIGAVNMAREKRGTALIFFSFPVIYIILMACQRIMFARNLLVLIPFLAVLAARGFINLEDKIGKHRIPAFILSALVTIALLINARWLFLAAQSIKNNDKMNQIAQLNEYLNRNSNQKILISRQLYSDLFSFDSKRNPNIIVNRQNSGVAIFYAHEVGNWRKWKANKFNYVLSWFGPYEVNFNYYPCWRGEDRILVMPIKSALELGIVDTVLLN